MLKKLRAWYDNRVATCAALAKSNEDQGEWDMIGEPVKAIILSMRNSPGRWRLRTTSLHPTEDTELYSWERERSFIALQLTDRVSGKTFRALHHRVTGFRLFTQVGFNLNGWEQKALIAACRALHTKGIERLTRAAQRKRALVAQEMQRKQLEAREALKKELML